MSFWHKRAGVIKIMVLHLSLGSRVLDSGQDCNNAGNMVDCAEGHLGGRLVGPTGECNWEYIPQHGQPMECSRSDEIMVGRCGSGRNEGQRCRISSKKLLSFPNSPVQEAYPSLFPIQASFSTPKNTYPSSPTRPINSAFGGEKHNWNSLVLEVLFSFFVYHSNIFRLSWLHLTWNFVL